MNAKQKSGKAGQDERIKAEGAEAAAKAGAAAGAEAGAAETAAAAEKGASGAGGSAEQKAGTEAGKAGEAGKAAGAGEKGQGAQTAADAGGEGAADPGLGGEPDFAEAARREAEQWKDQLLRLTADFDNYRKRTLRDKQDWSRYASQSVMEKLLPVMDGLDAAASAVNSSGQEAKNVAEGFLMIQKQLTDILGQEGLLEIPALGEDFDPNVHEAVMTVARSEGQEDNQVVTVLRKGYMYKDKVLRPAMVQVAKD